jgi:transposase
MDRPPCPDIPRLRTSRRDRHDLGHRLSHNGRSHPLPRDGYQYVVDPALRAAGSAAPHGIRRAGSCLPQTQQLYRDLREEHTAWGQRIHATLFHQGVPGLAGRLSDPRARALLEHGQDIGLSPAGAQAVAVALRRMDDLETALAPVHAQIAGFARRQAGCKTLAVELYGVGPLVAAIVWAFLGDTRRFSSFAQAVRHTGLDITVYSSDGKRTSGHLSHQGPPILRWALFEAGHQGSRASSPDHLYYTDVASRIDANGAALSVARKLARRSHHILRRLGDAAYAPVPGW